MLKNFIIIFSLVLFLNANSNEIAVVYKIENEIVTSRDVENEINYLKSLNQKLENLNNEQVLTTAKNSLVREKIKKNEIDRLYNPDYSEVFKNERLINTIERFYKNLGYGSLSDFKIYLKTKT